jgi:lipoate-protein ligase A
MTVAGPDVGSMPTPQRLEVVRSTGPAVVDLAREAWMLERAAQGHLTLLLASWPGPVVVLGYGQSPYDVDLDWCRQRRIPVYRRLTGGTGVVHDHDLSVSLALPANHPWAAGIVALYGRLLDLLEPALRTAGSKVERVRVPAAPRRDRSPICFEDQLAETLLVDGAKAVGCAQTRRQGAVVIHAAVLCGLDPRLVALIFGVEPDRIRRGLAPALDTERRPDFERAMIAATAEALALQADEVAPREVPERFLAPYQQPRWSPVPVAW